MKRENSSLPPRDRSRELSDSAILCERLAKSYRIIDEQVTWRVLFSTEQTGKEIKALKEVSFRVPKGEILGVLGRNGSGKSTMLRVVGGVYSPTSGRVRLNGNVGSLFELGGLGNQFITGAEYAERVLRFQGVSGPSLTALLEEIRDFSELNEYFERRIHTFSAGMAARLYFSTAMALPREVFLIDEVLSVGDAHFQAKSWKRVRERLSQGSSGVLVTHDWSAVIKLCHRAIILDKGHVVEEGRADKVVASYLSIPPPDTSTAEFHGLADCYTGVSGEDLELNLSILAHRESDLEFAFSIELLRLGVGWEIMLMSRFDSIGRFIGIKDIRLAVQMFPLAPGRYSLNLFLRARTASGLIAADARTWTLGTGLDLMIDGTDTDALVRIPSAWKIERCSNA